MTRMKIRMFGIIAAMITGVGFGPVLQADTVPESRKVLLLCSRSNFNNWLQPVLGKCGLKLMHSDKKTAGAGYKEKGYALPDANELEQYSLVAIFDGNLTSAAKKDALAYVKNGGIFIMCYTSLGATAERTGEPGFGICGFSRVEALCEKPYTGKVKLAQKIKYTVEMGKQKEFSFESVYTPVALDLTTAKALAVKTENPEMALATIAGYGKGKFIFIGYVEKSSILTDVIAKFLGK